MSTPSIIAIQNNNGEYDAIYRFCFRECSTV